MSHSRKLVRSITAKFTEADFEIVRDIAEGDGKHIAEWCRESLLGLVKRPAISLAQHALLAEIAANQSITISLLFAFARDGKLPETKVREILERARKDKFAQATEILRQASVSAQASDSHSLSAPEPKRRVRP
jgi:hypothetical protein